MVQVLYIDTLFFVNFAMDFFVLYITGSFLHIRKRLPLFLLASLLGGVYAVLAVVYAFPSWLSLLLSPVVAVLLSAIAFRGLGSIRSFLAAVLLFMVFSMLFGGVISAFYTFLEGIFDVRESEALALSDVILILGFVSFGLVSLLLRFFGKMPREKYATVIAELFGKTVYIPVLVDSGCLLSDPISGRPAIVVRLDTLAAALPAEIVMCARGKRTEMPGNTALARRCRLLPAKGLGSRTLLLSVRPERLTVQIGKEKRECEALLALYSVEKNHFGGRDGLLPTALLSQGTPRKDRSPL
ncbi:MAG: sigma-E processing peptidase SpoIIGA [Clostridia bacterium]|nr:sigma-E processing peptidase SpoIIGA [Clostridia bacterium]